MITKSEDYSFLAGATITTVLLVSALLSQEMIRFDTLSPSASKTESVHNITIINAIAEKKVKLKKLPLKKIVKKKVIKKPKKIIKKKVVKKEIINEDASIKERLAKEQEKEELEKKLQEELALEQKKQEELARLEELRRTKIARANKLKKQKDAYLVELTQWIKQHLKYPRSALRRNQEGVVKISFIINKDGAIHSVKIASACPYKKLNEAAKKLLTKHNHFKPIPKQISRWELNVPIIYALKD